MSFEEFQEKLKNCKYCKEELHLSFEPRPLIWGNQKAKIVQISQAPSLHASILVDHFPKMKICQTLVESSY
jgi:uracil-DNA glycosylase